MNSDYPIHPEQNCRVVSISACRALWAVRVLDAWLANSASYIKPPCAVPNPADGGWSVFVHSYNEFQGDTPDEARFAAAQAVFSDLPADMRADLGGPIT